MAQLYNSLRPQDVHADGRFQRLVKLDCGRRMKHDRHAVGQNLLVGLTHAQLGKCDVSKDGHQFVQTFRSLLPQPVKNLQINKICILLRVQIAVTRGIANLGSSWMNLHVAFMCNNW